MLNLSTRIRIRWPVCSHNTYKQTYVNLHENPCSFIQNVLSSYDVSGTVLDTEENSEQERQESLTLEAYILVVGDARHEKYIYIISD